ncbi:MAG: hypothetical protein IAE77_06165 [Prosthecobacter sp.]|jgi:hypothetical protein|uniref:hypothetical protein n=1 Tax=Prosthecobacter sp. TaxID=1965333 RepID=UPI0019F487DD|nr:hypothetical protein [Prosthecobacter sp.]MBE2283026.1 hypothetical protein [Prosthecobacter sp.]
MWQELLSLWQNVRDPEYLHLLLEPLPLYGLGIGLTFVIVSFVFGELKSRMLALAIICVSCASVWPYIDLRDKATPRILATRSPEYAPLIQEQTQRRKDWSWPYYVQALLSLAALATTRHPKGRPLLLAVVILGAMLFWFSIWMHKKECEVYHRNIVRFIPVR